MAETATASWRHLLPVGRGLDEAVWLRRHNVLSILLVLHIPALLAFGIIMGFAPLHVLWEVGLLALAVVAGQVERLHRVLRETSIATGLLGASALLVHLSGGYIEAHFHFFVMLPLVAMYQRWIPFIAAVGFVLLHHGVVGVIDPESVYNHPAAIAEPWTWAGVHAGFVALECLALFRLWREVEVRQDEVAVAQASADRLMQVQAVKERLLRVASHELSTPLTPIKLQMRLMNDARVRDDPERRDQAMVVMQRNFQRLERIVGTVLDAVRVENDAMHLNIATHDLSQLAAEAVGTYQEVAGERGVTLRAELVPCFADVDAARLSQVLDNLLSNAIKYTPAGGSVSLAVRPDGDDAILEISDTGAGLDGGQIERLFQPFGTVHGREQSASGTGLGLYICKGIVERHGGSMGAESPGPSQGSRFWVRLPQQRVADEPIAVAA